jgi:hypothetical protein
MEDRTEDRVVSADCRSLLVIVALGVANVVKLRSGCEHGTTEPHGVALHVMRDDIHFDFLGCDASLRQLHCSLVAVVGLPLDIALQPLAEILEHGGASRQDDVLVQATTHINWARLHTIINKSGERSCVVRGENLRAEEDLRSEETLITDINSVRGLGNRLNCL